MCGDLHRFYFDRANGHFWGGSCDLRANGITRTIVDDQVASGAGRSSLTNGKEGDCTSLRRRRTMYEDKTERKISLWRVNVRYVRVQEERYRVGVGRMGNISANTCNGFLTLRFSLESIPC
jgi:hypothetical protein